VQPSSNEYRLKEDAMPIPDIDTAGAPCWIELSTKDPDASHRFYGELFGWTVQDPGEEYGGYVNFLSTGQLIAGCMRNEPDQWVVYLRSDDAKSTADTAAANGGQVVIGPMDVMELGTMAFVIDNGQAGVGIWQPGLHRGFEVVGEPGAPAWFELHTRDYDAAVDFYRKVFDWDAHVASDEPTLHYTTLGEGESALAGIMDASAFLPAGAPSSWSVYFAVDDADATLAKAVELGGSIVQPAEDTPYGRLAQAADSTGALFRLAQRTNSASS
jgi:predicted enzyme related to lactoylglutathione lyase